MTTKAHDNLFVGRYASQVRRRVSTGLALAAIFLLSGCTIRVVDERAKEDHLIQIDAKQQAIYAVLNAMRPPAPTPAKPKPPTPKPGG